MWQRGVRAFTLQHKRTEGVIMLTRTFKLEMQLSRANAYEVTEAVLRSLPLRFPASEDMHGHVTNTEGVIIGHFGVTVAGPLPEVIADGPSQDMVLHQQFWQALNAVTAYIGTRPRLCVEQGGIVSSERYTNIPGLRLYLYFAEDPDEADPYAASMTIGALVLFNLYDVLHDEYVVPDHVALRILAERYAVLPKGTHAQQLQRARMIARALDDGGYLAVRNLEAQHWLTVRDIIQSMQASRAAALRYTQLRDYLINEECITWLVACTVAMQFTQLIEAKRWS